MIKKKTTLSFGCSRLGKAAFSDTTDIAHETLQLAFDLGINRFDTATNYTYGHSEKLLGEWIANKRDLVHITSKGGLKVSKKAQMGRILSPIYSAIRPILISLKGKIKTKKNPNYTVPHLQATLEKSLKVLNVDYLDSYVIHSTNYGELSDAKVFDFLQSIKQNNKVKSSGISFRFLEHLSECTYIDQLDVIQVPLNYYNATETYISELQRLSDLGITIVARTPFARGILTKYDKVETGSSKGKKDDNLTTFKTSLIEKYNISEIQLALWFIKDLGFVDTVLFSSFTPKHLKENIDTFNQDVPDWFSWKDVLYHKE